MPFFDVYSLFNNVPLDETINIYVKKLFSTSQTISDLNKQQVSEMLSSTIKEKIILFDEQYQDQRDGVVMGAQFCLTFSYVVTNVNC